MHISTKFFYRIIFSLGIFFSAGEIFSQWAAKDYAVQITASISEDPTPRITLNWLPDTKATSYSVSRKLKNENEWSPLANLKGNENSFTDTNISTGSGYEYQVLKSAGTGTEKYLGSGYIYTGIKVMPSEKARRVLILVDETVQDSLASELKRLEDDLIAENWEVVRKSAPRAEKFDTTKLRATKKIISDEFNREAGLTTVFLFGRIAVPYAGDLNPDAHSDHKGAWPADVYYADMDEKFWRDKSTTDTSASRKENWNVPGDGKFDGTASGSALELIVGRVDLYNMPAFKKSEIGLLRQYLNKNHDFRSGKISFPHRALIDDHFGSMRGTQVVSGNDTLTYAEAFAATGWRNFSPLIGSEKIVASDWFTTLDTANYLWAYGCGPGSYNSAGGIGVTGNFSETPVNAIFTMLFGSYFGDWDTKDNLLRAPLASSPTALTSAWAGRPHWFLHHMGLGETIGYAAHISQMNNGETYLSNPIFSSAQAPQGTWYNNYPRYVHIALMGDPTLTQEPSQIAPPTEVKWVFANSSGIDPAGFQWEPSKDSSISGYFVYRSKNDGQYIRITQTPVTEHVFSDYDVTVGDKVAYAVRAVKLINSVSGSYYIESPSQITETIMLTSVEENSSSLSVEISPNPATSQTKIFFGEKDISSVEILDLSGKKIFSFEGKISPEKNFLTWNLTDANGSRVPAGVYLVKISSGEKSSVQKIVVMPE